MMSCPFNFPNFHPPPPYIRLYLCLTKVGNIALPFRSLISAYVFFSLPCSPSPTPLTSLSLSCVLFTIVYVMVPLCDQLKVRANDTSCPVGSAHGRKARSPRVLPEACETCQVVPGERRSRLAHACLAHRTLAASA